MTHGCMPAAARLKSCKHGVIRFFVMEVLGVPNFCIRRTFASEDRARVSAHSLCIQEHAPFVVMAMQKDRSGWMQPMVMCMFRPETDNAYAEEAPAF